MLPEAGEELIFIFSNYNFIFGNKIQKAISSAFEINPESINIIRRIINNLLSFVIPELCISCENPTEKNRRYVCSSCYEQLMELKIQPIKSFPLHGAFENVFTLYYFRDDSVIQKIIHAFKYEKMINLATLMGTELGEVVRNLKVDFIIPVPLHISKLRERTYNQSELIARGISGVTGFNVNSSVLTRTRYTKSQTGLGIAERQENVSDAFAVGNMETVSGKSILLVDDVITTGATIKECAKALNSAGASKIYAASVAYATGTDDIK